MLWIDEAETLVNKTDRLLREGEKIVYLLGGFTPGHPDDVDQGIVYSVTPHTCLARAWSGYGRFVATAHRRD